MDLVRDLSKELIPFAKKLKYAYGGHVYLVGSALFKSNSRDVDIRVILPDELFEQMFGNPIEWMRQGETGDWSELRWKWSKVCTDETHKLQDETGLPIDFQIYPESFSKRYDGLPKLLLA